MDVVSRQSSSLPPLSSFAVSSPSNAPFSAATAVQSASAYRRARLISPEVRMSFRHGMTVFTAVAGLVLTVSATVAQRPAAQLAGPAMLELSSTSQAAQTSFRAAMFHAQNVDPVAARADIAAAVKADPKFGLARAYAAFLSVGTAAEREGRVVEAMAHMGTAAVPELLLAMYWREVAAGRGDAAVPVLRTLTELIPGDADVAYVLAGTADVGKSAKEQAENTRRFLGKYPQHAAGHNVLAYSAWEAGDPSAALAAVREYERLAPNQVNPHDSYADMLLLMRQPAEALPHVQRELEIEPGNEAGQAKLGTIHLMLGDIAVARTDFAKGLAAATTPGSRYMFMHWQAVADVYARDGRSALRQLTLIGTTAKAAANVPSTSCRRSADAGRAARADRGARRTGRKAGRSAAR
jgi:tetratricopeptide (TPR) repeat protein